MKNIINLLLLFGLILVTACESQPINTGTIHGVVTDYATGEPIKNAGVTLMPIGYTTITGSEGQFQFDNLEPRTYQLMIQKTGYEILTTTNLQLSLGAIIPQNLQMTVMPPSLKVLDDKGNAIDTLFFDATLADDNIRLFNILNDGVEDLNWEVLSNSRWIKSIQPQSGVLKTTETVGIVVEIDRSLITNIVGEESTIHIVTNNGSKELKLSLGNAYEKYNEYIKQVEEYRTLTKITSRGFVYSVLPEEYTSQKVDWYTAIEVCESISYAGYHDWFLPDVDQLSNFNHDWGDKEIWSSEEDGVDKGFIVKEYYHEIFSYRESKSYKNSVRCIREEKELSNNFYKEIPTVYVDNYSIKVLSPNYIKYDQLNWEAAIKFCESLTYAGYDDWYLPSKNELNAIYINKAEIGGLSSTTHWSSTESSSTTTWLQNFVNGKQYRDAYSRDGRHNILCIRKN